eukprot:GHRR01017373.1.p1 GENE.GHRR01017373.1~~GHRR01017373.1.p1  ORF type:complete len:287 (+),score=77.09 GHRR01017373.1:97-957(+)
MARSFVQQPRSCINTCRLCVPLRPHRAGRGCCRKLCSTSGTDAVILAQDSTLESVCQQLDRILAEARTAGSTAEQQAIQLAEVALDRQVLKAFGRGRQVPKRIYTIEELRLNMIEPEKLLSPKDESLNFVRNVCQGAAASGLAALTYFSGFDSSRVIGTLAGATFLLIADQVANAGGGEALIIDTLGRIIKPAYKDRVTWHEAGHFLIAYLVGLLPKDYTLSSLDAFKRYRALNVQAGCQFCGGNFDSELAAGRISSSSLDRYSCVALAGEVLSLSTCGLAKQRVE